jgi:hypothetical protein
MVFWHEAVINLYQCNEVTVECHQLLYGRYFFLIYIYTYISK